MKDRSHDCAHVGFRKIIHLRWKPRASLVAARGLESQGCRPTEGVRRGSRIQRTKMEPRREPSSQRSGVGASSVHSFAGARRGRRLPHCRHLLLPRGAPPLAREVPRARLDQNSCLVGVLKPRLPTLDVHLCLEQKHICLATSVAFEFILIFVILAILLNLRA